MKNNLFILTALLFIAVQATSKSNNKGLSSPEVVSVEGFGAKGDGLKNDAPAIQQALDCGADTVIIPQGIYMIGTTLLVGSNTTIKAEPQTIIRLANGAGNHVDVFLLTNKNPGNGNSHITVEGGIWDGNNEYNYRGKDGDMFGYTGTAINFVNVKNLILRNLTVRNPDAFSIRIGEVTDFLIENIVLDHSVVRPNQDGIHIGGFSQRGIIRCVKAIHPNTPNDDMIAINADDNVERVINLGMRRGLISNITVEDIQADGAYNFVRLLSNESPIDNITIKNVKGACRYYAVNINNWRFPVGVGNIRNVRLEDFNVTKRFQEKEKAALRSLIHITLGVCNLYVYNFQRGSNKKTDDAPTLLLNNGRENAISKDGVLQKSPEFTILQGDIKELWVNPWFSLD